MNEKKPPCKALAAGAPECRGLAHKHALRVRVPPLWSESGGLQRDETRNTGTLLPVSRVGAPSLVTTISVARSREDNLSVGEGQTGVSKIR